MSHFHLLTFTFSFPSFHLVKQPIFVQSGTSGRNVQKECGGTSVNINLLPINHLQFLQSLRLASKHSHRPVFIISADGRKELWFWRGLVPEWFTARNYLNVYLFTFSVNDQKWLLYFNRSLQTLQSMKPFLPQNQV